MTDKILEIARYKRHIVAQALQAPCGENDETHESDAAIGGAMVAVSSPCSGAGGS